MRKEEERRGHGWEARDLGLRDVFLQESDEIRVWRSGYRVGRHPGFWLDGLGTRRVAVGWGGLVLGNIAGLLYGGVSVCRRGD
jgi:hypothetical protein